MQKNLTGAAINAMFTAGSVNRPGAEYIRASLYDSATYTASTGHTQLNFFQLPIGQSGKTLDDTNMQSAGQLPAGQKFLVKAIKISFLPGVTVDTFTAVNAALPRQGDDVYTFSRAGWLKFFIGSKSYVEEGPLGRFPSDCGIDLATAQATNSATTGVSKSEYARLAGRVYLIEPGITLIPNQNFSVSLNWKTALALPSAVDAKVFIHLDGFLMRNSQ